MIPVSPANEPKDFDRKVRQPGLAAIGELIGRPPSIQRRGPRRRKVAAHKHDIPAARFPPFWRNAIDDMMTAYEARCAYLAMHIMLTGSPTIDHAVPKSRAWDQVYEWSNYRLCTAVVNAKKGEQLGIVDPFETEIGWFELDLPSFKVVRGASAPKAWHQKIDATLPLLNIRDCWRQRQQYVEDYRRGPGAKTKGIDLDYLERRAPFIAAELRRQGQLVRGDQ